MRLQSASHLALGCAVLVAGPLTACGSSNSDGLAGQPVRRIWVNSLLLLNPYRIRHEWAKRRSPIAAILKGMIGGNSLKLGHGSTFVFTLPARVT